MALQLVVGIAYLPSALCAEIFLPGWSMCKSCACCHDCCEDNCLVVPGKHFLMLLAPPVLNNLFALSSTKVPEHLGWGYVIYVPPLMPNYATVSCSPHIDVFGGMGGGGGGGGIYLLIAIYC